MSEGKLQGQAGTARRTRLLALLVAVSAACAMIAYLRFDAARSAAVAGAADYAASAADLRQIAALDRRGPGDADKSSDATQLNQRLRDAALAAGLSDQLLSIEPGQPSQLHDSDLKDTPVFLQLNGVTLPQVVAFLGKLGADDARVIPRNVALTTPADAGSAQRAGPELWTTDVTLAFLTYSPRPKAGP